MSGWSKFGKVGKGRLERRVIGFFRDELQNQNIQLESTVFPKLDCESMVTFNKLAYKQVFLSHYWDFIQGLYPCLPGFANVIGDADIMFTINYPFYRVQTEELHGAETVQEFLDLTWRLIENQCTRPKQTSAPVASNDL